MTTKHNKRIIKNGHIYCTLLRFCNAINRIFTEIKLTAIVLFYTIMGLIAIYTHKMNAGIETYYSKTTPYDIEHSLLIIFIAIGFIGVIYTIGAPIESWATSMYLHRNGITNAIGEAPYLINKIKVKNKDYYIYEFISLGVTVEFCEDNRSEIAAALNANILSIKQGNDRRKLLIYAIPYKDLTDTIIPWDDELISPADFELLIGESFIGRIIVDLNVVPHMLIGGETGSGKSYLLQSLLWQCIKKNAEIYIADFKGGVDFANGWHNKTTIITDIDPLIERLTAIIAELVKRKMIFYNERVKNIVEYNNLHLDNPMPRIIFACDEVAELLDKTGLDKSSKEKISIVEHRLSTIARLGRAFGINLILATQRPDANILAGQIKNNIGTRICGRADEVLSRIILDDTIAAKNIPKNAQGLFITNNGTLIKGYYFEDSLMNFE